jgi:uncharacterized protein
MSPKKLEVIADTGFLVALLDRSDKYHGAAKRWLSQFKGSLTSVQHILTETSFFLSNQSSAALIDQVAAGWIELHDPDAEGCRRIALLLRKYADLEPDLADIALVWLAEKCGIRSILTVDTNNFSTYRIHGKTKFDLVPWQSTP